MTDQTPVPADNDDDDVEGHRLRVGVADTGDEDDVQGHRRWTGIKDDSHDSDDVEGHWRRGGLKDDDDVEGHVFGRTYPKADGDSEQPGFSGALGPDQDVRSARSS